MYKKTVNKWYYLETRSYRVEVITTRTFSLKQKRKIGGLTSFGPLMSAIVSQNVSIKIKYCLTTHPDYE